MSKETKQLSFDRAALERLRRAHAEAVAAGKGQFDFEGNEFVTSYAGYVIEYLDKQFGNLPPHLAKDPATKLLGHWRDRALSATRDTHFGAILWACFRMPADRLPRFCGLATITFDRFIMCSYADRQDMYHNGAFVGAAADLEMNVIRLAKHLNLTDYEKQEFAEAVRSWVAIDYSKAGLRFDWHAA